MHSACGAIKFEKWNFFRNSNLYSKRLHPLNQGPRTDDPALGEADFEIFEIFNFLQFAVWKNNSKTIYKRCFSFLYLPMQK
jgi:hypothetical protein